ncbi:MAG: class I poly(R)-hydroxyalkanoic acid synthase [Novosphingobium sp.]|nr:class I poly(R)-hydroxyalkanoic acid synthase [Novosphingobium sp.]MCP5401534.1 class I poly(R)-hydroxyalkanoic acid synthase [Novosphingobium sp.]
MEDQTRPGDSPVDLLAQIFRAQTDMMTGLFGSLQPANAAGGAGGQWDDVAERLRSMWCDFQAEQAGNGAAAQAHYTDPGKWLALADSLYRQMPLADPDTQKRLWEDGLALWENVLGQYGIGPKAGEAKPGEPQLPRSDRRFADAKWREQPLFAVIHQTYLMLADQILAMADSIDNPDPAKREQLKFATRVLVDALSPTNFPLTNPLVMERALETKGESLVKGMEHLIADLRRGQLTHTDPDSFRLGENIAVTPGKVVHETPLFQLIQYSPTTEKVLETPLVIFPPWINRFYILDLNPKKSFVRWAVEQGVTVFIASWKSADDTMGDVVWDDYIAAEIEAIDTIRERLKVPAVHAIGYCVAGTTLAATLAVLARRGEADKVKSATFFTAQVDFEQAGDLKHFVDDYQIDTIGKLSPHGYLDGRYMAATFNLLRDNDLIWDYVVKNYLLGEDYPAFDLLHWNGDVTNLPAKWHQAYLRDLYRDNRLVVPDAMSAGGTPIDIRRIETPCYIQAGREDHIAPPDSVWKITRYLKSPWKFVLAGSGHIAGVVNPPASNKYQYWTNDGPAETLEEFLAGATEHPGSWWSDWVEWLKARDPSEVPARGKRKPGGRGDRVIEDAPGRYVKTR